MPRPRMSPTTTPPLAPPEAHLDAVRRRLAPGRGRAKAGPSIFIRHYHFHPVQAPGWHALRERHSTPAGLAEVLRVTRATLAQEGDRAGRFRIDVYECASHEAARALLLHLLTGFEILPEQVEWEASADWAAARLPGDGVALFARGNLALLMTSIGANLASAAALAAGLDAFFCAEPGMPAAGMGIAPSKPARAQPMLRYTIAAGVLHQRADGTVGSDEANGAAHEMIETHFDEIAQGWRPSPAKELTPPIPPA